MADAADALGLDAEAFIAVTAISVVTSVMISASLAAAFVQAYFFFFFFFFFFNDATEGVILSGAPRLRFFIQPVMRPMVLFSVLCAALRGIVRVSTSFSWLGGRGFVMVALGEARRSCYVN